MARPDRTFTLMFVVMLTIAAGNTALQSVLPALGRSLGVADAAVAAAFSVSALMWVIAAPFWANRSERYGHRRMVLLGMAGFTLSQLGCGLFLLAGINGWLSGAAAFGAFVVARMIYGSFGAAAPPAVQAIVAGRTSREERTRALALLASAFGLGTILGPALAPYLVVGHVGRINVGLSGPAFFALVLGAVVLLLVARMLHNPAAAAPGQGAVSAYPSIGGQSSGASVTAATAERGETVTFLDQRIRAWVLIGLVMGHAQAMTGQAIGFLIIDRLALAPAAALEPTGLVLMMGAGAALLVQWGLIPLLDLRPRTLTIVGLVLAAVGCAAIALADSLYGIATAYALSAMGFGFVRPGYTAGASLAVGQAAQGSVAGKITSVNGASFVLGPSIGVALYGMAQPLPYLTAAAALLVLLVYALLSLRPSARDP
ncbi:Major Facilitator Superfamily protein [Sphingomonas guangdongensis]|uniref:Major Facilitator Superfamily protein n=1 Tax=Sphingomonas guangdongensis TaxID=1141890 RepID=A0A285QEJ7_9SPHN|nr:MFS transporter [Sphingomonas guangdongensis]SOB80350.1 Major Facilitator Superfamily protein [Sphingomonas guangdongensis]